MLSRFGALLLALLLMVLTPTGVNAHADLVSSTPQDNEVVTTLPPEIVLTFNEALAASSSFDLVDSGGHTVLTGHVDPADAQVMRAELPNLPNGDYEVRWAAVTEDAHIERPTFGFTIAVATPPPTSVTPASAAPSISDPTSLAPSSAASVAPTPAGGGQPDASETVIPIAIALVLIGGGMLWLLRRRREAA